MPNDTLAANAASMPTRRTAIGAIAAGSAMLAASEIALASHPDAELFALARRVKALDLESEAATDALEDLQDNYELPPAPQSMLVREGDEILAGGAKGSFASRIGTRFTKKEMDCIRGMRLLFQRLNFHGGTPPNFLEDLERVTEINYAADQYLADLERAREAAGIPAAIAKSNELHAKLQAAWRELVFTPARTVEGVVAKLEAVSHNYAPRKPENLAEEDCTHEDVVEMAVAELADLHKPREA